MRASRCPVRVVDGGFAKRMWRAERGAPRDEKISGREESLFVIPRENDEWIKRMTYNFC